MNRYKESMDKITLAPSADERIRRNIQAAADQSERRNIMKKGRWKRNIFRNLSAASVAAVLTLTIAVTAFAAGLIRIVLKTQNWGNYSEISFEAADESYVDLKPYLPESMPEGYERTFVSDSISGSQTIHYANEDGKTVIFEYGKPDTMELSLNNIESRDKVKVGGHEGILYTCANSRTLLWTDEEQGIGYDLDTDDLSVDLLIIAESVAEQESPLVPTRAEFTEQALSELGVFAISELPEGYTEAGVSGAPTSEGGGWYGHVIRRYENRETNSMISFSYETYRLADEKENTAENVLALSGFDGSEVEVNGLPGLISADGIRITWVDTERSMRFHIYSETVKGEELYALANSVR